MADNAMTLPAGRGRLLSADVTARTGFTHYFRVLYSDINGAGAQGDTVTVTLGSTPTKYLIDRVVMYVSTAFAYASGSATLTGQVGTSGETDALVEAVNIKTAGSKSGLASFTDNTGGTASNTLNNSSPAPSFDEAGVNAALVVCDTNVSSLAAKLNHFLKGTPIIVGTTSTNLKLVLTCQNTTGGLPTNISAGEMFIFVSMTDLDKID